MPKRIFLPILVALLALVLIVALFGGTNRQALTEAPVVVAPLIEPREVVLYFVDSTGLQLAAEEREIAGCNDERQCIAQTLTALAEGSAELQAVIPARTRVLGIDIVQDLATINLSRDLSDHHPGGSLSELLSIYSVANTLRVNFPYLRSFQFLIDGEKRKILRGHVDISGPIEADFRLLPSSQVDG